MQPIEFMASPVADYVVLGLGAGFLILLGLHLRLRGRVASMGQHYRRLVRGGDGQNLEEILDHHLGTLDSLQEDFRALEGVQQRLEVRFQRAVQNVGLVRFNPFQDTGGDQSFSIALLDGVGDGIVITSLYSRSGTRTFAKPIAEGASKYSLTDEERQAISLAREAASPMKR